eukprot:gene2566-1289_t
MAFMRLMRPAPGPTHAGFARAFLGPFLLATILMSIAATTAAETITMELSALQNGGTSTQSGALGEILVEDFWETREWIHACVSIDEKGIMRAFKNGVQVKCTGGNACSTTMDICPNNDCCSVDANRGCCTNSCRYRITSTSSCHDFGESPRAGHWNYFCPKLCGFCIPGKSPLPTRIARKHSYIGRSNSPNNQYFHGSISDFTFMDGHAVATDKEAAEIMEATVRSTTATTLTTTTATTISVTTTSATITTTTITTTTATTSTATVTTTTATTSTFTTSTSTTLLLPGLECSADASCRSGSCRTHCCGDDQSTQSDTCNFCGNDSEGSCYSALAFSADGGWQSTTNDSSSNSWKRIFNKDERVELPGPPVSFLQSSLLSRGRQPPSSPRVSATLAASSPRQAVAVNDTYMTDEPAAPAADQYLTVDNTESLDSNAADDEYLSVATGVTSSAADNNNISEEFEC